MGNKNSLYDSNILSRLNPDINLTQERVQNISNKINININDNISNLYKRDTTRSKHAEKIKTDPNAKLKKSKKNKEMTKEQRILLKKLLKENVEENKKTIAKNLIGLYLVSKNNIKQQIKPQIKQQKKQKKLNKMYSETPKSKYLKKEIKKVKPKFRKYASVVNITTHFSKFKKKKIEEDKVPNNNFINNTKDDLPDNKNIEKLNINDDTYGNDYDNDDDDENVNDFGILNFTSLAKMTNMALNDSTISNPKEENKEKKNRRTRYK